MQDISDIEKNSPLGKATRYDTAYSPDLLFAIPRAPTRQEMGIPEPLPFQGIDIWNAFELSWLNAKGKPEVGIAEIKVPCESPNIFESKSLKLYLFALNNTRFPSTDALVSTMQHDLSACTGGIVTVKIFPLEKYPYAQMQSLEGLCLDSLDIECDFSQVHPEYLALDKNADKTMMVEEKLYSNLYRSNCLITHQPDWASVYIYYKGPKISHEGLLKYLISYRNHNEFHEPCAEHTFMDIMQHCAPQKLTVDLRYTRRGGIDINPFRSNWESAPKAVRLVRQ